MVTQGVSVRIGIQNSIACLFLFYQLRFTFNFRQPVWAAVSTPSPETQQENNYKRRMSIANTQSPRERTAWFSPGRRTPRAGPDREGSEGGRGHKVAGVTSRGTYLRGLSGSPGDRQVHLRSRYNLKVHVEALTGISAFHRPDGLDNTDTLRGHFLENGAHGADGGCEGSFHAQATPGAPVSLRRGVSLRSRALGDLTQQAHDASLEANNKEHDFSSYCEGGQLPVFNLFVSGTHIFPRASCILSDKQWQSFVNVYI